MMGAIETAVVLTMEGVCGAAAGLALGRWTDLGLGAKVDALTGATGGLALTWLAGRLPGVARFVGHVESAVDATARGVGVLTPGSPCRNWHCGIVRRPRPNREHCHCRGWREAWRVTRRRG